jgi:hypothetical protein
MCKIPALHLLQEGTSTHQEEVTAEQQQAMEEAMQQQETQLMSITGQALDATLPTNSWKKLEDSPLSKKWCTR